MNELNDIESKIITTEDPVEYDIDGLIQCQIRTEIGLTFARCLRSILRQDPDTVLVGEIRDLETAEIAVQAALTGHLVFSTLHTNDAPSTVARLMDLGLESFLITATIEGIVGQRLVRKICDNCKAPFFPTEEMLMELDLRPDDVAGREFLLWDRVRLLSQYGLQGVGWGFLRLWTLDDELREAIMKRSSTNILRDIASRKGMESLRSAGLAAIFDGLTTIEEVVKETVVEEV